MEEIKTYTLSILTDNIVGLTQRVVTVFTRRKLNIDSFSASQTENESIYRFTIMLQTNERIVESVAKALENIVEVYRVIVYEDEDLVYQELALYKVSTKVISASNQIENIVRAFNARILFIGQEYTIIEKAGHKERTQELFEKLKPFGVFGFSRSGRVALSNKPMTRVNKFLEKILEKDRVEFKSV